MRYETDYLVIGAGAAGLAFTDSLIAESDAEVLLVDRRQEPGGHWNDAYSFVRLHQPSAFYGVNSRRLGTDRVVSDGPEAGFYERATGPEILEYFRAVLDEQLLPSGQVVWLGGHNHVPDGPGVQYLTSRATGEVHEVVVRRKVVDATYLETPVPASHRPTFPVASGVRFVSVNALAELHPDVGRYLVIGGGKTGMDACGHLLENGIDPDRITWVRPREAWLLDRASWQPLEKVSSIVEGYADELEAAANAESVDDLFDRLEAQGRLLRLDETIRPTMYRCATSSRSELAQLRRIRDVVRLGRVRRIESRRILFDGGDLSFSSDDLLVDCSAVGLRPTVVRPIFEPRQVTIQQVRYCSPTFNAALIGYVEATRDEPIEQNRLCPSTRYPNVPEDWVECFVTTALAEDRWSREPDLREWLERSRLNLLRGIPGHIHEERMQRAMERQARYAEPALVRLHQFLAGVAVPATAQAAEPLPMPALSG